MAFFAVKKCIRQIEGWFHFWGIKLPLFYEHYNAWLFLREKKLLHFFLSLTAILTKDRKCQKKFSLKAPPTPLMYSTIMHPLCLP